MNSIRTIHRVTGPTLTIDVPPDLSGKQVEVVIFPLEKELASYLLPKPALTEEDRKLFQKNPYPLRGTGGELNDPFEPAVPEQDWEVYKDDPA
jgi:hypothetical protein